MDNSSFLNMRKQQVYTFDILMVIVWICWLPPVIIMVLKVRFYFDPF